MTQLMDDQWLAQDRTTRPPAVELTHVSRSFGDVHAVRGVDLSIQQGEVVAFLGPNGAGKTTTIDMILGLGQPSSGTITVLGTDPRDAVAHGLVAAVMQTGGLLKDLTVRETLSYIASLFPDAPAAESALETAGIAELANRRVGKCSGGEQQRVRFAIALLSDPALLMLDEPTTGMDVGARRDFWQAIRADAARGRTVLFATHYLEEADQYADRIILINHGRIIADGTGAQIRAMASGRTIRALVPAGERALVEQIQGIQAIEVRGETMVIHAPDTDAIARELLTRTSARDVEITSHGLEEAFLNLTKENR